MNIKIDYSKCCWKDGKCASCCCGGSCVGCVEVCPTGAITRGHKVTVEKDKCAFCGACAAACKYQAISLE